MKERNRESWGNELIALIKLAQDPKLSPKAREVIILQIKDIQSKIFNDSPL